MASSTSSTPSSFLLPNNRFRKPSKVSKTNAAGTPTGGIFLHRPSYFNSSVNCRRFTSCNPAKPKPSSRSGRFTNWCRASSQQAKR